MKKLINQVCHMLEEGEDLVLATVCAKTGSGPRDAGARMIVRRDGTIAGTIGGGMLEAVAMKEAAKAFDHRNCSHHFFNLTNTDVATSDMICGGRMEVFLEYIRADRDNIEAFTSLLAALDNCRRVSLVSRLDDQVNRAGRCVIGDKGRLHFGQAPDTLLSAVKKIRSSTSAPTVIMHEGQEYLVSYFSIPGDLFLVGAGHVAACTAEAAARVGFRVIAMDDRAEFANRERFPQADETVVLSSFADCFNGYPIGPDSYIVIVTRGHMHDREVLEQALATEAGYVGMIGSRRKRDTIYHYLLEHGTRKSQLDRVHCPIGLSIAADTPEEIAVSIVAELIQERAAGKRREG